MIPSVPPTQKSPALTEGAGAAVVGIGQACAGQGAKTPRPLKRPPRRGTKAPVTRKPVAVQPQAKHAVQAVQTTDASPGKGSKKLVKPRATLVRDSLTMPEADYALIATLKLSISLIHLPGRLAQGPTGKPP